VTLPPMPPPGDYRKPWKSYDQQVVLLQSRGLMIDDPKAAAALLAHINYYRFSGYCLTFETARHVFAPGTRFEQVAALYEFDRILRDLVSEALEVVEVDVRTAVAYHFGERHGAFGHVTPAAFFSGFNHAEWLEKLREESRRSSEIFIDHYKIRYREYPDLPIWTATEIMSFGGVSHMVSGMQRDDQIAIARRYGVHSTVLGSWLHHLVYMRNLCAHHLRLWDRTASITPDVPVKVAAWKPPYLPRADRLFGTLLILNFLMGRCPSVKPFAAEWRARLAKLIDAPVPGTDPLRALGLNPNWKAHPLWR